MIIVMMTDEYCDEDDDNDDCGVMCTFLKELFEGHLKVDTEYGCVDDDR